jgi:hypothetical protein
MMKGSQTQRGGKAGAKVEEESEYSAKEAAPKGKAGRGRSKSKAGDKSSVTEKSVGKGGLNKSVVSTKSVKSKKSVTAESPDTLKNPKQSKKSKSKGKKQEESVRQDSAPKGKKKSKTRVKSLDPEVQDEKMKKIDVALL